jgi:hypothetical protein
MVERLAALVDVAGALELGADRSIPQALFVRPPDQDDDLGSILGV